MKSNRRTNIDSPTLALPDAVFERRLAKERSATNAAAKRAKVVTEPTNKPSVAVAAPIECIMDESLNQPLSLSASSDNLPPILFTDTSAEQSDSGLSTSTGLETQTDTSSDLDDPVLEFSRLDSPTDALNKDLSSTTSPMDIDTDETMPTATPNVASARSTLVDSAEVELSQFNRSVNFFNRANRILANSVELTSSFDLSELARR